jgi:hypothetical protein
MKAFIADLFDSSLDKFISRKVSGVLYIITAWLIVAATALMELALLIQLTQGQQYFAFLGIVIVPVASLLTLILVRMAFEAGIALIVIAENTKK